jgi:septal ring factor EnvC (AmiA/AmiB activator)
MSQKKEDGTNAFNQFIQLIQPLDSIARTMQRMIDGAKEAEGELAEHGDKLARLTKETAAAKRELEEYTRALPAVKERMTAARAEERRETAEREDRIAALDATIEKRQAKLSALENAINERANQLGNLIARELT